MSDPIPAVEPLLRASLPAARLVRARHARAARLALAAAGRQPPGDPLPVWLPAAVLASLGLVPEVDPCGEPAVLLLPEPDDLLPRPEGLALLRWYWRRLVQGVILHRLAGVTDAEAERRLAALGPDAATEVRFVLVADHLVPPAADPAAVYRAFAAVYLDAVAFEPGTVARTFPLLAEDDALRERLAAEVGLSELVARCRPGDVEPDEPPAAVARPVAADNGEVIDAEAEFRRGNAVRAAIGLARAGDPAAAEVLRTGLVDRLAATLGWDAATAARWHTALVPLLAADARGWSRTTRALYDLQKIVTDLAGEPVEPDPAGWLLSFGRRPLRRPVPRTQAVALNRHLLAAEKHLRGPEVAPADCDRLAALLADARHAAEAAIRDECGPVVQQAVTAAGLVPGCLPERVALDALTAELLDRVCERGFVRFADLRDAVARNALKLDDLASPGEFWRGDALLRADRRLADDLAGVYRPAEGYLRWIHRLTAAVFGTPAGRWLCLWVLLPFGGGLMAVEFAKYVAAELAHLRAWVVGLFPADKPVLSVPFAGDLAEQAAAATPHHGGFHLGPASLAAAAGLGLLFLALLHRPAFRRRVLAALRAVGTGLWVVLVRLPAAVWDLPPVRAVRRHPVAIAARQRLGTAALVTAVFATLLAVAGAGPTRLVVWSVAVFLLTAGLVATAFGRRLEEDGYEALSDGWRTLRHNLLPGLVGAVVDLFRAVADRVERGLYAVDERLRFRDRDSRPAEWAKLAAAAVWHPVAYVTRFAFYLLVEPQVNPVKHFPVVTVSHKLLLPAVPSLASLLGLSTGTTAGLVSLVPGVFGFIAWELKESWRLYRANRPAGLPPLPVGHHGETVRGLLRPGFHSGTVPKLFARLRRGDARRAEAAEHELHAVAHTAGRFADRHLGAYLRGHPAWSGLTPAAGPVRLGVQTAGVTVGVKEFGPEPVRVTFTHRDGTITVAVERPGWCHRLTAVQRAALDQAIAGLAAAGAAGDVSWDGWVRYWGCADG